MNGQAQCSSTVPDLTTAKLLGARIMADADISMNYACVTRRASLLGAAAIALNTARPTHTIACVPVAALPPANADAAKADPLIALWQDWRATHDRVQELSQRLQDLEVALAEQFDTFGTIVPVPGGPPARVYSVSDLHCLFGDRPDMVEIRSQAERELAAKQADFDSVSEELGYFPTMQAEQAAFTKAKVLLDQMIETQATSLAGVAAKLDAVARWGEAWDERPKEFPWPQVRSAHADLVRMG
jgi:hypothetical protein